MIKVMAKDCLAEKRIREGLTGVDVAEKIGMTKAGYYSIERGDNGVSPANAKKISEVLGCGFDELFRMEGEK